MKFKISGESVSKLRHGPRICENKKMTKWLNKKSQEIDVDLN